MSGVESTTYLWNLVGEGEYSEVFHSVDLRNNKSCVAKVLKPVKKRRAKREIKILEDLSGGPNIVKLVDVARNNQSKSPSIVTEYINNTYHRTLYPTFNDTDVRFYMFQLLRAVEFAHSKSIMHRDIKPYNVMIDHENRKVTEHSSIVLWASAEANRYQLMQLRLIDWGLSDYYNEEYYYTTSVGSRYWRAPELLVDYEWYHLSSDIWSVGCMLAALIFEKEPFFRGRHNDIYQLIKIVKVLGTDDFFKWLSKYEIELDDEFDEVQGWYKKRSWGSFVDWHNRPLIGDDAFDLLSKLLVYDHNVCAQSSDMDCNSEPEKLTHSQDRLTATEALAHPYFDPVREEALSHPSTVTIWNTN